MLCPTRQGLLGSNLSGKQAFLKKYDKFAATLDGTFPNSVPLADLVADLTADLKKHDFKPGEAIPMISVCRDEITRPLVDAVESIWGNSFSLGSIAGMIFTGTTGLGAGMHHAPDVEEVERFIFIVAPHIAISDQGVVGQVWRPGVPAISSACGSLVGFLKEIQSGSVNFQLVTTDLEQSMMKGQMSTYFQYGSVPSLADLTKDAQKLIKAQLNAALGAYTLTKVAQYAVLSGVQIHGPEASTFFWPTDYYKVDTAGNTVNLNISALGSGVGAKHMKKLAKYAVCG